MAGSAKIKIWRLHLGVEARCRPQQSTIGQREGMASVVAQGKLARGGEHRKRKLASSAYRGSKSMAPDNDTGVMAKAPKPR